jgi:hypothetical protein
LSGISPVPADRASAESAPGAEELCAALLLAEVVDVAGDVVV